MTAAEYAVACGEVMREDEIGYGESGERDFIIWVGKLLALQPPPEVEDYHRALAGQYLMQIDSSASPVEVLGPNEETEWWRKRWIEAIFEMPESLKKSLVAGGCLEDREIDDADRIMAAVEWMERDDFLTPNSIDDYLKACLAIKLTTPTMDAVGEDTSHFIRYWSKLSPPPEFFDYHVAVLEYYLALHGAEGDPSRIRSSIVQEINDVVTALDDALVGKLVTSGCGG